MALVKRVTSAILKKPLPVFSHASICNGLVFVSGIQGFVNEMDGLVLPSFVAEEAENAFKNLNLLLEEVGSSKSNVVKITLLLVDMNDFQVANAAFNEMFPDESTAPARVSVAVHQLPRGCRVVVDCIAALELNESVK